ncbi:MAG: chemotaxis-specific protein-glutamate methyltransferase CheB [Chloroflexia bacterium]|nr:chemotaxis-specific protein-glutamate methyltransferase CheB [Chloroflexia bacterium]
MIRVLVVDDSPTVRELLVYMLQTDPQLQVVGVARDGLEAVNLAARLQPDVITMDIRMPRLNGFQATKQIMQKTPTPIVVVSASVESKELQITFNALRAGALTVVEKPSGPAGPAYESIREQLVTTVKLMSEVKVVRRWATGMLRSARPLVQPEPEQVHTAAVAIAASTGGPNALYQVLGALPANFPVPIVIVQHIARGFGQGLVDWLERATALRVQTARQGQSLEPGVALVAPDDRHLLVRVGGQVLLRSRQQQETLCPSADFLFASVAEAYGRKSLGIILTGMGQDGVQGLRKLKSLGGRVLAQDESSCVVFGMPKEAIAAGVVDRVVSLEQVAATIAEML